jgi:hypothetical protein
MDYIVIIAVRSGTGVLYGPDSYDNNRIHTETYNNPVSDLTAITIESIQYSSARRDSYDNNRIHTETYNTPVPDLTAITIESILRHAILHNHTSWHEMTQISTIILSIFEYRDLGRT